MVNGLNLMKTAKNDYLWMLKPISEKSKKIREQGRKQDARRAGVKI